MLNEPKYMENFYHQQCIQIRKQIRQMDMYLKDLYSKNPNNQTLKQQQSLRQDVNFLVIGPNKSGKSCLLKSMFFALNSHLNIQLSTSQLPSTLVKRYDIKKNKRYNIQGLQKLKQTQQKRTISAFQFQNKFYSSSNTQQKQLTSQQKSSKIFQKYSNALQIIDNKVFGCFKVSSINNVRAPIFTSQKTNQKNNDFNNTNTSMNNMTIRTVLIVLNIIAKIQYEQLSCMKFFVTDIRQKGLKILIILTHIDKLNKMKQTDKLTLIQQRIQYLKNNWIQKIEMILFVYKTINNSLIQIIKVIIILYIITIHKNLIILIKIIIIQTISIKIKITQVKSQQNKYRHYQYQLHKIFIILNKIIIHIYQQIRLIVINLFIIFKNNIILVVINIIQSQINNYFQNNNFFKKSNQNKTIKETIIIMKDKTIVLYLKSIWKQKHSQYNWKIYFKQFKSLKQFYNINSSNKSQQTIQKHKLI